MDSVATPNIRLQAHRALGSLAQGSSTIPLPQSTDLTYPIIPSCPELADETEQLLAHPGRTTMLTDGLNRVQRLQAMRTGQAPLRGVRRARRERLQGGLC